MPKYNFKAAQEILWLVLSAILPILIDALMHFDAMNLNGAWLLVLLTACVRAVGGAILAFWTKHATEHHEVVTVSLASYTGAVEPGTLILTGAHTLDEQMWAEAKKRVDDGATLRLLTPAGEIFPQTA